MSECDWSSEVCSSDLNSNDVFLYSEKNKKSIPSNNITGLYIDSNSRLWISTAQGICSMSKERYEFERYSKNISTESEGFFLGFIEYAGKTFTYGHNGLYEIDEKNKILLPCLRTEKQVIYGALIDLQNYLWVTNGVELIKLNASLGLESKISLDKNEHVNCMISYNNSILLGTDDGLKRLNSTTFEIEGEEMPDQLRNLIINQMLLINDTHKLLINTRNRGVLILDLNTNEIEYKNENVDFADISSIDITATFIDRDRNIWLGTFDRCYYMLPNKKKIFNEDKEFTKLFRDKFITRIIKDHFGNFWIGTRYNGILFYDTVRKTLINYNEEITPWLSRFKSNFVQEIFCDSQNRLWVGYGNQLIVCNITRDGYLQLEKSFPGTGNVVTIAEDSHHRVWAGSSDNGLYIYNTDLSLKQHKTSAISNSNNITKIISLSDDKMLFSAYMDNIYIIDINTLIASALDAKYQNDWCNTIDIKLTDNSLWIGTYGNGLMEYNFQENKLTQYNDFSCNDIVGIESDVDNNIWASSSYGIYRISPSLKTINAYFKSDGIGGNQFHEKCTFIDPVGYIYFGGNTGLEKINPNNVEVTKSDFPTYLTDFKIFGNSITPAEEGILNKDIAITKELELNYKENVISLEFTSICYDGFSLLEFAYMLKGYDQTWNYIGKYNRATYSNLPAGNYTFMVKVRNRDGIWGEAEHLVDISVKPAPWLHPVAILSYIIIALIITFFLIKIYIRLKLAKERINLSEERAANEHKMSQMKINFFTNISHELRTPLTLIYAPLKMLRESHSNFTHQQIESNLDFISNNVDRLLNLIDQLLQFRSIKNETLPLRVSYHDCVQQLTNIVKLYNIYASEKNICIEMDCTYDSLTVMYDADKLDKIINNLLMNATKYSFDNGRIIVKLNLIKDIKLKNDDYQCNYIEIKIIDNGIGIDENDFKRLFNRFTRFISPSKRDQIKGFGIGLNYVYNLVDSHKGKITAEHNATKGMTFTTYIPVSEYIYSDSERVNKQTNSKDEKEIVSKEDSFDVNHESNINNELDILEIDKKKILIIEDNIEMNNFITSIFGSDFEITTAFDGLNGLQRAVEIIPDIIISDVLMPYMNGYELCKEIKENKDTCHIPIILLTAKTMDEDQIKGYDQGADIYITKPFNPNILISIVNQMIARLNKQQALLIQSCGSIESKEMEDPQIELSPLDEKFLNKLYKYIEDNIANSEINVNLLGRELGYSRTNFYRKIKALTNVTPNDLLKAYRLNRAAELILKREYTLGEISEMTGFGTQSHFSSLFKKHFGVSPKDYLSNHYSK